MKAKVLFFLKNAITQHLISATKACFLKYTSKSARIFLIKEKTRIFSVYKFSSKHCQRAFTMSIFHECVTSQKKHK